MRHAKHEEQGFLWVTAEPALQDPAVDGPNEQVPLGCHSQGQCGGRCSVDLKPGVPPYRAVGSVQCCQGAGVVGHVDGVPVCVEGSGRMIGAMLPLH